MTTIEQARLCRLGVRRQRTSGGRLRHDHRGPDGTGRDRAQRTHGKTEVEVWSEFHRHLIAHEGEYVSTRLFQAGERTFPYFQEAGSHRLADGDLVCIDTDAIGYGGYGVDFSRTFVCGGETLTSDAASSSRIST